MGTGGRSGMRGAGPTGLRPDGSKVQITLNAAVRAGSPRATPTARDWRSTKASAEKLAKNTRPLSEQVGTEMWPTPTASESANRNTHPCPSHEAGTHGRVLAGEVGGSLNPAWVERLMGFPDGWTEPTPGPQGEGSPSTRGNRRARSGGSKRGGNV